MQLPHRRCISIRKRDSSDFLDVMNPGPPCCRSRDNPQEFGWLPVWGGVEDGVWEEDELVLLVDLS